MLAVGLDPVVGALVRRGWARGRAAVAVFAGLFVSVALIVLVTVGPLWDQVKEFVNEIPEYWEEISSSDAFETFVSSGSQDDCPLRAGGPREGLPDAASTLLGVAGGVFGSLLSLVTLTFLALFMLIERHTITEWLFGFARPEVEARWQPVLEDSIGAVSSSLIGNLAISLVAAVVAGVSAWIFGLPFPIVLAVMTGFLDLIPQVGATLAAVDSGAGRADRRARRRRSRWRSSSSSTSSSRTTSSTRSSTAAPSSFRPSPRSSPC